MEIKFNELGLDHKIKHNQITVTSKNYEDPIFLETLEASTFDVVRYTKSTDDKLEEKEFTFRLMSRQYNNPYDLDLLNGDIKTKVQEQEIN